LLCQYYTILAIFNQSEPKYIFRGDADDHSEGPVKTVSVSPFDSGINGHPERLDPENVYGQFDATQITGINEYFFGVASREWVEYTFDDGTRFCNVEDPEIADIRFREVI